jgi:phosphoglycerate dehydrogenase-like enzyme
MHTHEVFPDGDAMRLLIACSVDPDVLARLSEDHDVTNVLQASEQELTEAIPDKDVLLFRSGVTISQRVLAAGSDLKLIIRAGSGLDNIDVEEVRRRGLKHERIPGPSAQAVAELAFAHMLALARNVRLADSLLREGHWSKYELPNFLLSGKTLGVVGVGNIGGRVGELGVAWGMRAIGCVHPPSLDRVNEFRARGIELTTFDDVVRQADFLTVHVPLNDSTRGLIGAEVLARMKVGSFLVNMARGGVVVEAALYEALTNGGRLRGAGLDVHENEGPGTLSPLRELPNVVLTPHVGATTEDTQSAIGQEILAIVETFESGRSAAQTGPETRGRGTVTIQR